MIEDCPIIKVPLTCELGDILLVKGNIYLYRSQVIVRVRPQTADQQHHQE